ncbi:MAG: hypothetical protein EA417_07195 [Gammaproteobacteria bacterium]|nr:MAG: hypothetical protein EA417_07195 [Gammaproteobacteria bacterium]
MATPSQSSRKRGVRASRPRLYHALTEAGFRSQAALAERIADLEELDHAPKDLVSRVFREQPVELQTLERVARALGTEAWTLYKTSDEPEPETGNGAQPSPGVPSLAMRSRALPALLILVLLSGGIWWITSATDRGLLEAAQTANQIGSPLRRASPTLVLQPFPGDEGDRFTGTLRSELGEHFQLASPTATILIDGLDPEDAARRLRAQAIVDGEIHTLGRFSGIRVYLYSGGLRQQVWAETVPASDLPGRTTDVANAAARAIAHALGLPAGSSDWPRHYPLAPIQDYYLEGRVHLDGPASELNIRRAQSRFEAALRQDANYADAHAGLCEALLEEYWMEDAQRALSDAALACGRALQLAPEAAATRIAQAHYYRVTGRLDESLEVLEALLAEHPDNSAALVGLAATRLQRFRSEREREELALAKAAAQRATAADPGFWKPPFWLAILEYFAGDIDAAIAAAQIALERDENEFVLANLGTFHFCADELPEARWAYERARDVAPHSYVGDEFLGMLLYLLGDFEQSAALRQRAINRLTAVGEPEIHEMWGNLADAYLLSGEEGSAIEAFVKAAEIAERDVLQGIETPADRASRAYYYTMLLQLAPETVPTTAANRIVDDLRDVANRDLEPGPAIRLAKAWLQHGRPERALAAFEQAVAHCSGYASTPELASLRTLLAAE